MKNNRSGQRLDFFLALPSFILVLGVTLYVFFNTLIESLGYIPALFLNKMTLMHYGALFQNRIFIRSFLFSFGTAMVSTALSTAAGVFLVYMISRRERRFAGTLYKLPIILSYIAAAVLIYNTYSDRGVLYHILSALGHGAYNLNIIYNSSGIAVVLLYMFKAIPFVALSIYPIFSRTDLKYREAAENLGCTNSQYIFRILLPICKRAILASALIVFNYNLFSYEGFYYLGPSNPPSIGVMAYQHYISADMSKRAAGMAINMTMMVISLILCVVYYHLIKEEEREVSNETLE